MFVENVKCGNASTTYDLDSQVDGLASRMELAVMKRGKAKIFLSASSITFSSRRPVKRKTGINQRDLAKSI